MWNAATFFGAVFAHQVTDPVAIGLDLVFPLAFLALLLPLLVTRSALVVAVLSGAIAWTLAQVASFGVAVLVAGVAGAALGAVLSTAPVARDAAVVAPPPAGAR